MVTKPLHFEVRPFDFAYQVDRPYAKTVFHAACITPTGNTVCPWQRPRGHRCLEKQLLISLNQAKRIHCDRMQKQVSSN